MIHYNLHTVFSDFLVDFETSDSDFNDYIDSLLLNTILKNLNSDNRKDFIYLLNKPRTNNKHIQDFILDKIPNFESIIAVEISDKLIKGLF